MLATEPGHALVPGPQSLPDDESEDFYHLFLAAHHEAAHAIVRLVTTDWARAPYVPLGSIILHPDAPDGAPIGTAVTLKMADPAAQLADPDLSGRGLARSRRDIYRDALVSLAGFVAEAVLADEEDVFEYVVFMGEDTGDEREADHLLNLLRPSWRYTYGRALAETEAIVREHWLAIQAVADALMDRDLTPYEVVGIAAEVMPEAFGFLETHRRDGSPLWPFDPDAP